MAQRIESDKLLVKDVLTKWYRIPEYQRPYVWEKDQVNELLGDIMTARNSNASSQYFLGSMVLKKSEKAEGTTKYEEFDLLDGQQRLTTLFLIFAVIRDITPQSNKVRINTCQETIFKEANPDYNSPERMRIVFDIREDVKNFVEEFVKPEKGTLRSDDLRKVSENKKEDISIRNMAKAVLIIHEFFQEANVDHFFPFLCSNVLMIYVSADELEDAFRMFTVMNNRGIKLRNSDILKAENLGKVLNKKKQAQYAKRWEEIEKYFGEDFDNFMSYLRTILVKRKAVSSLLKEFSDNIYKPKDYNRNTKKFVDAEPLLNMGEDTFVYVEKYFKHYQYLFDTKHFELNNDYELYNYLQLMSFGFEADFWVAPLLRFYDKYKTANLVKFVKALDNKFASDWLIGYTPTDRIENVNKIIQAIDDSDTSEEVLESDSLTFRFMGLDLSMDENIYGRRTARYLLLKLDLLFHGHTTEFNIPSTVSIEHILPQNPDEDSQWALDFPGTLAEEWVDRLGNLVLISRRKNSAQGNRDYEDKKTKYFKNNVELFSNSIRIYRDFETWTLEDLQSNHSLVSEKLKESFRTKSLVK